MLRLSQHHPRMWQGLKERRLAAEWRPKVRLSVQAEGHHGWRRRARWKTRICSTGGVKIVMSRLHHPHFHNGGLLNSTWGMEIVLWGREYMDQWTIFPRFALCSMHVILFTWLTYTETWYTCIYYIDIIYIYNVGYLNLDIHDFISYDDNFCVFVSLLSIGRALGNSHSTHTPNRIGSPASPIQQKLRRWRTPRDQFKMCLESEP